jgi:hypothetical protein
MRNKVIWSFLSLVALATSGLVAGCDSDAKIAKSSPGESCTKTSDCEDDLKCLDGTCYKSSASTGGSANSEGGEGNTAGTTPIGPKPPVLGGLGESCTKRADCEDGLACLAQRCSEDVAVGAGGEGSGGPALGGVGETCGLTSDCSEGLACLPGGSGYSYGVGVCKPIDSGIQPTGKECGAECEVAADCCELPVAQQTVTGAASCAELSALVDAVPDCAIATGVNGAICLAFNSYCDANCGTKTWACENGACQFAAKCTKATAVQGGCPSQTRGGTPIPACDVKSGKCIGVVVAPTGCTTDASCATMAVFDHPTDTCVAGECVCQKTTGGCFRKCSESTDCEVGYTCDEASTLCMPIGGCETDLQCVKARGDINAKCSANGVCTVPCAHDVDCNANGLTNGAFSQVCGADKTCVAVGCESNEECPAFVGGLGVKSFCTAPRVVEAGPGAPHSALTD